MKFLQQFFLGAVVSASLARAVVVDFAGSGTYVVRTGSYPSYTDHNVPFSVSFSYDSAAITTDPDPALTTQRPYPALSLTLTINRLDGSFWTHTSHEVALTVNNAVNSSWDGMTISTKWPMTEVVPAYTYSGVDYPVINYSLELTKYGGGVFTNGDLSLPSSPTFIGDLSTWDVKHAKLYIRSGSNDIAIFNQPLTTLGAPTAVPEPSTYAAIAGACALGFVAYRRRQRTAR